MYRSVSFWWAVSCVWETVFVEDSSFFWDSATVCDYQTTYASSFPHWTCLLDWLYVKRAEKLRWSLHSMTVEELIGCMQVFNGNLFQISLWRKREGWDKTMLINRSMITVSTAVLICRPSFVISFTTKFLSVVSCYAHLLISLLSICSVATEFCFCLSSAPKLFYYLTACAKELIQAVALMLETSAILWFKQCSSENQQHALFWNKS